MLTLFFQGCYEKKEQKISGKKIDIAVLVPISGKNRRFAKQSLAGLEAAHRFDKYLSNGDEIVLHIYDTKSEAIIPKEVFTKKPAVIFSYMSSGNMLLVKEQLQKENIPVIMTLATRDDLVQDNGVMAQVCINNHTQALVASHYIYDERFIKHVGLVYDAKNKYSNSLRQEFQTYFTDLGGVVDFMIDASHKNALTSLPRYKNGRTKVLFDVTNAATTALMLKNINKNRWDVDVLGTDGLLSSAIELDKKEIALFDGIYIIDHFADNIAPTSKFKKVQKYLQNSKYKRSSYAFLAYDGYQLLLYALENCKNKERKCIGAMIRNSDVIMGAYGNFSMQDNRAKREIYIDKVVDGKLKKEIVIY
jgi:ABC-type branched-subunit amino acid transport system substrate-binding protein